VIPVATDEQVKQYFKIQTKETPMSKLQTALKATVQLRKNYKRTPQPTLVNPEMQDALYKNKSTFGCNFDAVLEVFGTLLGEDLKKPDNAEVFTVVNDSFIVALTHNPESAHVDVGEMVEIYDTNRRSHFDLRKADGDSWSGRGDYDSWRPATPKEIKAYFKSKDKVKIAELKAELKTLTA